MAYEGSDRLAIELIVPLKDGSFSVKFKHAISHTNHAPHRHWICRIDVDSETITLVRPVLRYVKSGKLYAYNMVTRRNRKKTRIDKEAYPIYRRVRGKVIEIEN